MENQIVRIRSILIVMFMVMFAMISVLVVLNGFTAFYKGTLAILTSPSILISDYLEIGGLAATLFNVATILLLNIYMINRLKIRLTGPVLAGILTIAGFSFFGKNLFNTLPIYLGIYLYARTQRLEFKSFIIVVLFSTGISPVVSFMIFGIDWSLWWGIPTFMNPLVGIVMGLSCGLAIGFILPVLSAHTIKFHKGYDLYNVGFALGILSMAVSAILTSFEAVNLDQGGATSTLYHAELFWLVAGFSALFIFCGFINDPRALKGYPSLLKSSGRLVSDFVLHHGAGTAFLNIGIMGFLSLLVVMVMGFAINGPLMGAILTVMGFGAFGKHPKNTLPVMAGAILAVQLSDHSFESTGMVIAVLFVTALAPIAGRYGVWAGILAGFLHVMVTPLALNFQEGGFNLYNNGFAAGFIAALLIPFLEMFTKSKGEEAP
ncbi:MAG: DUF1576 domain-containing protein [Bacillota bacterium]